MRAVSVISLIIVGSAVWASSSASMGCDSCGQECVSTCGTRLYRTCCFNYLRRKREFGSAPPAALKLQLWLARRAKEPHSKLPLLLELPDDLPALDDDEQAESRLQLTYDA